MEEVRNLDGKLVCGVNRNEGFIEIVRKDCVTRIAVDRKGMLAITQERIKTA